MEKNKKIALTLSGGFDSGCLPFLRSASLKNIELIFFNYDQSYLLNELEAAKSFAAYLGLPLSVIHLEGMATDFPRRNFIFIAELKKRGFHKVIMGNRNLFPLFDKYKDSNLLYLKFLGFLLDIRIDLPVVGWSKKRVFQFLKKAGYSRFYNCYNNKNDFMICQCPNCIERRRSLLK